MAAKKAKILEFKIEKSGLILNVIFITSNHKKIQKYSS